MRFPCFFPNFSWKFWKKYYFSFVKNDLRQVIFHFASDHIVIIFSFIQISCNLRSFAGRKNSCFVFWIPLSLFIYFQGNSEINYKKNVKKSPISRDQAALTGREIFAKNDRKANWSQPYRRESRFDENSSRIRRHQGFESVCIQFGQSLARDRPSDRETQTMSSLRSACHDAVLGLSASRNPKPKIRQTVVLFTPSFSGRS